MRATKEITWDTWQKEFIETKGDKILCCGRQVGKSEVASADAGEFAHNNKDTQPIVMIAPTERQAYALFTKTLNYLLKKYPAEVITKGKDRPTKQRIKLRTGVEIYCLPVGKDGLGIRFLTIGRLYVDEASRVPELVWDAIEPALLTTGGDEILLSTPFGAEGMFYEVWINRDNAFSSFQRFSITSEKVMNERPICETWTEKQREKSLNKLEQAKKRWSQRKYAQEYLGEFVEGLYRWFNDVLIRNSCTQKRRDNIEKGRDYFLGVDLARMGDDKITYEIFDKIDKDRVIQVESIVEEKKLTTETEDKIRLLNNLYQFVDKESIGIDAGAGTLGVSVYDHLLRIDDLKNKIVAINNAKRVYDKEGKEKATLQKNDLYDNARSMMERGVLKLLDDEDVIESLRSVQYEYVQKEGSETKLRIYGDNTHIVEGIIRAAWLANQKSLNLFVCSIKI